MDIITTNPFRILGVYSNAKPVEIVSNCDDMEAYLNIGQKVSSDLDLNNLMPNVVRSADSVINAKKRINLPKDKLKYALFWFFKDSSSAHALCHLNNGDFDSANSVFEIEDTFSTLINKAVVAMIRGDLETAISYTTKMIHDDELRTAFVSAICDSTFLISEDEMAHLYIDTLLEENNVSDLMNLFQNNGTSKDDDDYLRKKAIGEHISRINSEIAKAKAVKRDDAEANYKAGIALMNNTKNDLAKVKSMLGTSDMKYQMLADDLANTILQCGINYYNINYYNNTDDDDYIANAMILQKYACKIAVGKLCKERCNQNLAILEKKKEEQVISSDITFIINELKSFKNKLPTIDNTKTFLTNCKSHLNTIKIRLGETNSSYIEISTAVANNALGMVIDVVNEASSVAISDITEYINLLESAMGVVTYIDHNIDKTKQAELHLVKNAQKLSEILFQAQLIKVKQNPKPTTTSGGCYIATMCYGDYDHPQVMVLRDFRDTVLLQHIWGQSFVRFYYRHSPKWVEHLKDKRLINNIIRLVLDKFIILYKYVKK